MKSDKINKILNEIHLYTNKVESLVKSVIWAISWIGGIMTIYDIQDKRALGSAYFIFSLSLLMEFVDKIKEKKRILSRIIHTLFCAMMVIILLISMMSLLGVSEFEYQYEAMFIISVIIMVLILLDSVIVWVSPEYLELDILEEKINNVVYDEQKIFKEKLIGGKLGTISEGEQNYE